MTSTVCTTPILWPQSALPSFSPFMSAKHLAPLTPETTQIQWVVSATAGLLIEAPSLLGLAFHLVPVLLSRMNVGPGIGEGRASNETGSLLTTHEEPDRAIEKIRARPDMWTATNLTPRWRSNNHVEPSVHILKETKLYQS
jgi:hypothetical protein